MKRFFVTFILSLVTLAVSAQGIQSERLGLIKGEDGYYLSYPTTTISVELLVEKIVVTPGIYARYAQKYLALRAPLVAQTSYAIIDGSISIAKDNYSQLLIPAAVETEYSKLPVDQYSSLVLSVEDAAREAASAIFTIRRQRRDIINGEAGEGYFGAGLKDAIEALNKMEQEYLELFLGHKVVSQSIEKYLLSAQQGATRQLVARFDQRAGVLPATDLSGSPIYLQFNIQAFPNTSSIEFDASKKVKGSAPIKYRVAASTQCVLYNDSQMVTSTIIPIYELGKDVNIESAYAK